MSTTKCISITKEQEDFLNEKEIPLSKLVQFAIEEKMASSKLSDTEIKEFTRRIEALQLTIAKQREFIEQKDLMNEYLGLKI